MTYEIVRPLAHGGMAELFLARKLGPQGFQKLVVIKRILPQLAEDARFVRLFLDEARLVACLDHPNIAQIHDVGQIDGQYCLTMEYVHGQDLCEILERGTAHGHEIPLEYSIQIARDVASALHHAHERRGFDGASLNIVHRDVSPSNILVSYEGVVKLIDFGVAKTALSSIRTHTGTLKGTAGYMAPEQVRGVKPDRRTDIYAVGIVLWELVAGQPLYGDIQLANVEKILQRVVRPPSELRPNCPRELDAIILRALAMRPEDRYQTAGELQIELEDFARAHDLALSPLRLGGYLQALFAAEIGAFRPVTSSKATVTDVRAAGVVLDEEPTRSIDEPDTTVAEDMPLLVPPVASHAEAPAPPPRRVPQDTEGTMVATRVYKTSTLTAQREPKSRVLAILLDLAILAAITAQPLFAKNSPRMAPPERHSVQVTPKGSRIPGPKPHAVRP